MDKIKKHVTLKEWKTNLKNAEVRGLLQEVFADFCSYYFKNRPVLSESEQCAFNQLGFIYQEKLKGVNNE